MVAAMAIDINSTDPVKSYTANGSTATFVVPWPFYDNADLKVYANGVLQTITTHYTVSGAGNAGGGSITFGTNPANGVVVTMLGDAIIDRTTHFPLTGPLNTETLNKQLNELTIFCKQLLSRIKRSIRTPDSDTIETLAALPVKATRANKYCAFDANGDPTATAGTADATPHNAFMVTFHSSGDAATARTNLGLGTAATTNTGTSNGNVPLIGATGLDHAVMSRKARTATALALYNLAR